MVAYSFQKMFAEDIRCGFKHQTVRGPRKGGHVQTGKPMQVYYGMRTKHCRKILPADPKVTDIAPVTLRFEEPCRVVEVRVEGIEIDPRDFACADGFKYWSFRIPGEWLGGEARRTNDPVECMGCFWREQHGLWQQWSGWLIRWEVQGIPLSPADYAAWFGTPIFERRYRHLAQRLGWKQPDAETIDGLPPDLPDLGVR